MELVKVKALQPFVGAYPCEPGVADHISNVLAEDDKGNIVTKRVAYKKVTGEVEYMRPASPADIEDDKEKKRLAELTGEPHVSRLSPDKQSVTVPANPEFVELPSDYAAQLAERGLVEVQGKLKKRPVANG